MRSDLEPGDVVQIDPDVTDDPAVRGCLMIVQRVESWGVTGAILVPTFEDGEHADHVRLLLYRAKWEQIEIVGRAAWSGVIL